MSNLPLPTIPDYEIIRLIGQGSYGDVWLGKGITGLYRAIKVVWRDRFTDSTPYEREYLGLKRFSEISLKESNQLAILHIGRNDSEGFFYYVMEIADDAAGAESIKPESYVPSTLALQIQKGEALSIEECTTLGVNLTHALMTLHKHQLVHRDIKPSNILIVNGVPKMGDIGLVTAAQENLTFVGTEGYIPPEGPGLPQADVFSLGKVLYELATGLNRRDFPQLPNDLEIRKDRKTFLEFNEILLRACDPTLKRRYQSAEEMHEGLLLLQAGKSVRRLYQAEQGLRRAGRWIALLVVIAGIALTGAFVERRRAENSEKLLQYSAALTQVRDSIERGDYGSARAQLAAIKPSMAGAKDCPIEWRILNNMAQGDEADVLRESGPRIVSIEKSFDGSRVLVNDSSGLLESIDPVTLESRVAATGINYFLGHSRNGKWYVGLDGKNRFTRWKVDDPSTFEVFENSPENMYPVGLDAQGRAYAMDRSTGMILVETCQDGTLKRHDLLPDHLKQEKWEFFRGGVGEDGRVAFAWVNLQESIPKFCLSLRDENGMHHFTPCEVRPSCVGVDANGGWAVMDLTGEEWRSDDSNYFEKTDITFPKGVADRKNSKNGGSYLAASNVIHTDETDFKGHGNQITRICLFGDFLLSGCQNGELRRWLLKKYLNASKTFKALDSQGHMMNGVFYDKNLLIIPNSINSSVILDLNSGEVVREFVGLRTPLYVDETTVVGFAERGFVFADISDLLIEDRKGDELLIYGVYAPGVGKLYAVDIDGRLYETSKGAEINLIDNGWRGRFSLKTNTKGDRLWAVSTSAELICYKPLEKKILWNIDLGSSSPTSVGYDSIEEELFVSLSNGYIQVRSSKDGNLISQFFSGTSQLNTLLVLDEENRIITGGAENRIQFFDRDDQRFLVSLATGIEELTQEVVLSPDFKKLVIVGAEGSVEIMNLD